MTTPCEAHRLHRPRAMTIELHHVIPQAWQNMVLHSEVLFDKRTVALCPTGHRNVHALLVTMMKASQGDDPLDAYQTHKGRRGKEFDIAYAGIVRFHEAGFLLSARQEPHALD